MTVPDAVTRAAQSPGPCSRFCGKIRKIYKLKRNVVCQPLNNGSLNFISFEIMVKSLRLAWIGRLFSNSDDNWKAIPNFYFDKYGGLPFLLKCNYSTSILDNNLPLFYCELLDYFQELAKFSEYDKNNDPILWNNRIIRIERNGGFGNNGLIRVLLSIVI